MKEKFFKLKSRLLEKLEIMRLKIATHPKIIIWRLKLFGLHPALGTHFLKIASSIAAAVIIMGGFYLFAWRSPRPFPGQALVTVERGESLSEIANSFKQNNVVRSSFWLKFFIVGIGGQKKVIAGDYYFPNATNVFRVVRMLHNGEFGLISQKVTIPEGSNSFEIAKILEDQLPYFKTKDFVGEVSSNNYEGYLFPDTYFFMPNSKPDDVILMMRENFTRQIQPYQEDLVKSGKSLEEIVKVASIVEDEANSSLDAKRVVAGIIWKRLRLDMPLQVDAAFQYYNGKNSYTLTKDDLTDDNPYNTYVNKGLPPTAITNPGIDSIRAAIAPTNTSYLYFLSDKKGNMYYAKDFDGHKRNRELYLN